MRRSVFILSVYTHTYASFRGNYFFLFSTLLALIMSLLFFLVCRCILLQNKQKKTALSSIWITLNKKIFSAVFLSLIILNNDNEINNSIGCLCSLIKIDIVYLFILSEFSLQSQQQQRRKNHIQL